MRAILINPENHTVTEVDYDGDFILFVFEGDQAPVADWRV